MANYTTMVDFCADVLGTVTGIGQIHKRPLHVIDTNDLIAAATTGIGDLQHLKFWVIYREGVQDSRDMAPFGEGFRTHRIVMKGHHYLDQAENTEQIFQNLIDTVLDAFETRLTRVNDLTPQIVEYTFPLNVRKIGHEMLVNTFLVHACEIEVTYRERRKSLNRI